MPALSQLLDLRWRELLPSTIPILAKLEKEIDFLNSVPSKDLIFRAFECDPKDVSVVIFGQDPYPNDEHAMGLAFSVKNDVEKLPPSLRNIFSELNDDIGGTPPQKGDLTYLSSQGVMLLNRGLTLDLRSKTSHLLWHQFTDEVAQVLAKLGAVGVFWGKQAQELARFFPENKRIVGVHPSPLSAYRGFFGSKPFSAVNKILLSENKKPIAWTKQ
ncbi:Ung Uracil DNA glycosylase [Candidatus Nanopelagicaceae bacterium]